MKESHPFRRQAVCESRIIYYFFKNWFKTSGNKNCQLVDKRIDYLLSFERFTQGAEELFVTSSECWFLIGHKKCFVSLCPISEQFFLRSFREFVHDGFFLATVARFVHQAFLTRNEESTDESKNVSDAISRSNLICTEKILFLTDHNVS